MMKLLRMGLIAIPALVLLAACGTPNAAPMDSSQVRTGTQVPTTTTPPPAIVEHGIVVAFCTTAYQPMSVVSYTTNHTMTAGHAFSPSYSSLDWQGGVCTALGASGTNTVDKGQVLRSRFNADFTELLTTQTVGGNRDSQSAVGWYGDYTNGSEFKQLSPPSTNSLVRQADINPMYNTVNNRVYYWDNGKQGQPPTLMSCTTFGVGHQPEPALGQQYPYMQPMANVHGRMYMANTTTPVIADPFSLQVFNKAGTKAASVFDQKLTIGVPGEQPNGSGTPINGHFSGTLRAVAFVDDNTLVLRDNQQIYRATLNGNAISDVTQLLVNDLQDIWDVTVSPDGTTVAFLTSTGQLTYLDTVAMDGSTANNVTQLANIKTPGQANILEFR